MLFLNDGNDIPQIGMAAVRTDSIDLTRKHVTSHLDTGVRHFEITELFGNGHVIVDTYNTHPRIQALNNGELARKEMFVTLKIWPKERKPADLIASCRQTLEFMGLTYADLVMGAPNTL
jgi:diketogulonate reductase-like aldo/keto reductase